MAPPSPRAPRSRPPPAAGSACCTWSFASPSTDLPRPTAVPRRHGHSRVGAASIHPGQAPPESTCPDRLAVGTLKMMPQQQLDHPRWYLGLRGFIFGVVAGSVATSALIVGGVVTSG